MMMDFKGAEWIILFMIVIGIIVFIPFAALGIVRSFIKKDTIRNSIEFFYNKLW